MAATEPEDEQMEEVPEAAPSNKSLKIHQHAEIVKLYNDLRKRGYNYKDSLAEIAPRYNRSTHGIHYIIQRYQPTVDLAARYLQSQALKLAMRVVRKANVTEALDLLSRKSMGVVAPKTEEGAGNKGFFLSVEADSCGAIKVGVAMVDNSKPLEGLPAEDVLECNGYTIEDAPEPKALTPRQQIRETIDENPRQFQGHIGKTSGPEEKWSPETRLAIQAARNRIKKARIQRGRETAKLVKSQTKS